MTTLTIDGHSLTIDQVAELAYNPAIQVKLDTRCLPRIEKASQAVQKFVTEGKIAYGITTGFGALKDRLIPIEGVEQLQENILLSHAVGVGDLLGDEVVRAMMLIRANTLANGHSGIRLETLQLLLNLLNANALPLIPEKGSLGASGDLAPLAHMALPLIGQGSLKIDGMVMPSLQGLSKLGLQPTHLAAKEGLALTNGTTLMTALGSLCVFHAERLIHTANLASALTLEAQNGTLNAFIDHIHQHRPQKFQRETAAEMRMLLEGSQLSRPDDPKNIQDAYTLRCIPQVHGAVHSAIDYAKSVVNIELNSLTDNPLLFFDEQGQAEIVSGGNFHGEPLALALDFLGIAMTDLGNISERRIAKLIDSKTQEMEYPPFLAVKSGINSGFMLLQYTAAALTSDNKTLSHPSSTDSIPSSGNVEDHVSMGANAARHCWEVIQNVNIIISIEMMSAAQAVEFRLRAHPGIHMGRHTADAYAQIRTDVPFFESDTFFAPYLDKLKEKVWQGDFIRFN